MADEKEFFNNGAVRVTNSRVVANGKTFAVNTLTSVEPLQKAPTYGVIAIGIILLFIGLGFLVANVIIAILLILAGGGILYKGILDEFMKPLYYVQIYTASGKAHAVSDRDKALILKIVDAINDAIVHRG